MRRIGPQSERDKYNRRRETFQRRGYTFCGTKVMGLLKGWKKGGSGKLLCSLTEAGSKLKIGEEG